MSAARSRARSKPSPARWSWLSGGVLFLDEVSEMSLSAQAKFLRVLQEREFQRLGGTRLQKANIRVIAATNRNLRKAVERGEFREDLFYRLGVFDIQIPPLRDRAADIVPLSETFLQDIGRSFGRPRAGLTREARQALLQYDWPGNVRELRNVLERAAILCEGGSSTRTIWPCNQAPGHPRGYDGSGRRRTHHDCQSSAGLPREQNESRTATWVETHAASPSGSKYRLEEAATA